MSVPITVERRAAYHGRGSNRFFAWIHEAPAVAPRDCAVLICPPVGHEYTRSHRSLRHLADRLARRGIVTMRFDYDGTGDSPGNELDGARVATWIANIQAARAQLEALTGRERICVIGIRLGATLATCALRDAPVSRFVLWNPVVKGQAFLRELHALAMVASTQSNPTDENLLEAGGFVVSAETAAELRPIDLLEELPRARKVLLVSRDDLPLDTKLATRWQVRGVDCAQVRLPGWAGMMAEHQFTVVPDVAIDHVVDWIASDSELSVAAKRIDEGELPETLHLCDAATGASFEEKLLRFGPERRIFGVLASPEERDEVPAVILFNAGSVHHVGPNRMYVALARHLAARGIASLRLDLTGLGDTIVEPNPSENHPYPYTALEDARSAIGQLQALGFRRFATIGLCSGAHAAFHSALELGEPGLSDIVLINPYTFHWRDGQNLETVVRMADAQVYRQSMRDPRRWMKLVRGDINFRRLLEVIADQSLGMATKAYGVLLESLVPSRAPLLARDLRRLLDSRRHVSLFIAQGDPGLDILLRGAPRTARRAIRSGRMRLDVIPGGDHTFTPLKARRELIDRVASVLRQRMGVATRTLASRSALRSACGTAPAGSDA